MDKKRCQSCGMPFTQEGFYGTEADGSENREYCKFCRVNGAWTSPDLTADGMVDRSVTFMTENLKFEKQKARELSEAVIPFLKRWNKQR